MEPQKTETPTTPANGSVAGDNEEQARATAMVAAPVVAMAPKRDVIPVIFDPNDTVALYMNTGIFEQLQRVAALMCSSNLVPAHLRGKDKQPDCFLVAAQAFRWRMDPFAVAQHTYVPQGKLGYEGKLIAALINASGRTEHNLEYVYEGQKGTPNRKVIVIATLKGESKARTIDGSVTEWQTNNEKWKSIPDQMLSYRGAREWARRHMPEVLLGIRAEEEVEEEAAAEKAAPRPRTLDALTERIETVVAPAPAPQPSAKTEACDHPEVPPSRLANLPKSKSLVCGKCGGELRGEAAPREPGSDDGDETVVRAFVEKTTTKAPAKGQRSLEE